MKFNAYAKTSFILSLLLFIPALNIVTSSLAIVFGVTALKDIKQNPNQKGRAFALVGITLGVLTIILAIIGLFLTPELFFGEPNV